MRRSARIQERAKFACPTCGEKFTQTSNMNRHVEEVHVKQLIHKCRLCNKSFVRFSGLERHQRICTHKQCDICQVSFKHRDELIVHKENVHGVSQQLFSVETFLCTVCKKSFSRKDKLNDHKKEVHHGQRFKCPKCIASFTQKAKLKNHMKAGKHKKSQHLHECSFCDTKFKSWHKMDRHIKEVHTRETQVRCPQCDKVFSREEHMRSHMRNVHLDKTEKFQCDICQASFDYKYNLKRHVKQVHENFSFKCQECSAAYTQKYKLEKHVASGNHLVDFYCHCCKKWLAFKNLSALENHVRVRNWGPCGYNCGFILRCRSIPRDKYYCQWIAGSKEKEKAEFIKRGLEGLPPYDHPCHCCSPDPEDFRRYTFAEGLINSIIVPV